MTYGDAYLPSWRVPCSPLPYLHLSPPHLTCCWVATNAVFIAVMTLPLTVFLLIIRCLFTAMIFVGVDHCSFIPALDVVGGDLTGYCCHSADRTVRIYNICLPFCHCSWPLPFATAVSAPMTSTCCLTFQYWHSPADHTAEQRDVLNIDYCTVTHWLYSADRYPPYYLIPYHSSCCWRVLLFTCLRSNTVMIAVRQYCSRSSVHLAVTHYVRWPRLDYASIPRPAFAFVITGTPTYRHAVASTPLPVAYRSSTRDTTQLPAAHDVVVHSMFHAGYVPALPTPAPAVMTQVTRSRCWTRSVHRLDLHGSYGLWPFDYNRNDAPRSPISLCRPYRNLPNRLPAARCWLAWYACPGYWYRYRPRCRRHEPTANTRCQRLTCDLRCLLRRFSVPPVRVWFVKRLAVGSNFCTFARSVSFWTFEPFHPLHFFILVLIQCSIVAMLLPLPAPHCWLLLPGTLLWLPPTPQPLPNIPVCWNLTDTPLLKCITGVTVILSMHCYAIHLCIRQLLLCRYYILNAFLLLCDIRIIGVMTIPLLQFHLTPHLLYCMPVMPLCRPATPWCIPNGDERWFTVITVFELLRCDMWHNNVKHAAGVVIFSFVTFSCLTLLRGTLHLPGILMSTILIFCYSRWPLLLVDDAWPLQQYQLSPFLIHNYRCSVDTMMVRLWPNVTNDTAVLVGTMFLTPVLPPFDDLAYGGITR